MWFSFLLLDGSKREEGVVVYTNPVSFYKLTLGWSQYKDLKQAPPLVITPYMPIETASGGNIYHWITLCSFSQLCL